MECSCRRCWLDDFNREMASPGPPPHIRTSFICEVCDQACDHALDHRIECPFRKWGKLNKFSPLKQLKSQKVRA